MEVIKILGQANPVPSIELGETEKSEILYIVPENKGCVVSYLNILNGHSFDVKISIQVGSVENIDNNPDITWVEYNMLVYAECSAQRLKGLTLAAGDMVIVTAYETNFERPLTFSLFGSEFDQYFSYYPEENGGYGYLYGIY